MFRVLLLLSILCSFSLSNSKINFEEEKYIDMLSQSFIKYGTLTFSESEIVLSYSKENKKIIYTEDAIEIIIDKERQTLNQKTEFILKIIFLLIDSIHKDNIESLQDFFTIKTTQNIKELYPKSNVSIYIKSIEYKKELNKIKFIKINMLNEDFTVIREINE